MMLVLYPLVTKKLFFFSKLSIFHKNGQEKMFLQLVKLSISVV